jgi:hypothetical protein
VVAGAEATGPVGASAGAAAGLALAVFDQLLKAYGPEVILTEWGGGDGGGRDYLGQFSPLFDPDIWAVTYGGGEDEGRYPYSGGAAGRN